MKMVIKTRFWCNIDKAKKQSNMALLLVVQLQDCDPFSK